MRETYTRIDLKKTALCSLIFGAVATTVHFVGAFIMQKFYTSAQYAAFFNPMISKSAQGIGIEFFALAFAAFFAIGAINAISYIAIKGSIKGTRVHEKGMRFAILLFTIQGLTAAVLAQLFLSLPTFLILEWLLEMIVAYAVIGVFFALILEEQQ